MKNHLILTLTGLIFLVLLFSGCTSSTGSSSSGVVPCFILVFIGIIVFILIVAYLLGGKKTIVQTQQTAVPSQPIIIRDEPKKETKSERRCPECGRVIPEDANMCPYCGKKFKSHFKEEQDDGEVKKKTGKKLKDKSKSSEYCSDCGTKFEEEDLDFCPKCGVKLE